MTTVAPSQGLAGHSSLSGLPSDELTALLDAMRSGQSWRDALRRPGARPAEVSTEAFSSPAKAGFYMMLPVPSDGLAVDLAAGSGAIAETLASRFQRVIAVESDARWCEFMRRRFADDQLPVEVANTSALSLPPEAKDADLVVMNEMLEWIAVSGDPSAARGRPWTVQLAALRAARNALRRGGRLGIAVANRWFRENWRSALLPRPVAGLMTRAQREDPRRASTYGAAGYRRLLRTAGFINIEVRAAVPSYREPVSVGPVGIGRAGLLGNRVHSFYISAERA